MSMEMGGRIESGGSTRIETTQATDITSDIGSHFEYSAAEERQLMKEINDVPRTEVHDPQRRTELAQINTTAQELSNQAQQVVGEMHRRHDEASQRPIDLPSDIELPGGDAAEVVPAKIQNFQFSEAQQQAVLDRLTNAKDTGAQDIGETAARAERPARPNNRLQLVLPADVVQSEVVVGQQGAERSVKLVRGTVDMSQSDAEQFHIPNATPESLDLAQRIQSSELIGQLTPEQMSGLRDTAVGLMRALQYGHFTDDDKYNEAIDQLAYMVFNPNISNEVKMRWYRRQLNETTKQRLLDSVLLITDSIGVISGENVNDVYNSIINHVGKGMMLNTRFEPRSITSYRRLREMEGQADPVAIEAYVAGNSVQVERTDQGDAVIGESHIRTIYLADKQAEFTGVLSQFGSSDFIITEGANGPSNWDNVSVETRYMEQAQQYAFKNRTGFLGLNAVVKGDTYQDIENAGINNIIGQEHHAKMAGAFQYCLQALAPFNGAASPEEISRKAIESIPNAAIGARAGEIDEITKQCSEFSQLFQHAVDTAEGPARDYLNAHAQIFLSEYLALEGQLRDKKYGEEIRRFKGLYPQSKFCVVVGKAHLPAMLDALNNKETEVDFEKLAVRAKQQYEAFMDYLATF